MPQLNPEFYIAQIFWLALVFSAIYCFVTFYFIPRIGTVVDKRESTVKKHLSDAQKVLEKQKELKSKMEAILEKARDQSSEIKRITAKDTEIELNQSIAKVEREMVKKLAKAEEKLARQKSQLLEEIEHSADKIGNEILKQVFSNQNLKKKVAN
jgi:F-type H+-transporting ATPase subunit b